MSATWHLAGDGPLATLELVVVHALTIAAHATIKATYRAAEVARLTSTFGDGWGHVDNSSDAASS